MALLVLFGAVGVVALIVGIWAFIQLRKESKTAHQANR